jgi:cytidine deaminase
MKDSESRIKDAIVDASQAKDLAYSPYSRFKMGAAVVTDRDHVIKGSLVENVSLGLSMCAERAALFSTVSQDAGKPEILALVSKRTAGDLTWPCGACLQVAQELGGDDLLIVVSDGKRQQQARLSELAGRLPFKG